MSHVLGFRKWTRVNEVTEAVPTQVLVSNTSNVKKGPPAPETASDRFASTPSCGPIKLVVFSEPKPDKAESFQGVSERPYIILWADNSIEFDGLYNGINRSIEFRPDTSSVRGIYLHTSNDATAKPQVKSTGISNQAEAFRVCFHVCRALFGNAYGNQVEDYGPMMWPTNVKGLLTAMQKITTDYPTYIEKNSLFKDFFRVMQNAANTEFEQTFIKTLTGQGIKGAPYIAGSVINPTADYISGYWRGVRFFKGKTV